MPIQTFCVYASPAEQAQLEQVARQGKTPQKVACRARMVLMLSNHEPPSSVAAALQVSRMTVRLWAARFVDEGVSGLLRDASRPGRRKQITPDQVQAVVEATLTTRPPAATHWSSRPLAKAQGLSDGTIRKIWRQHGLQPHRVGRFKLSKDPRFVEKLRDVVGLYLNPPAKAVVFCVDEKSGIQALDRTRPVLPLRPGVPERQTHDYIRHGTTTLYAALRVLDGVVIGECRDGIAARSSCAFCGGSTARRRRSTRSTSSWTISARTRVRPCGAGSLAIHACIFTLSRPAARG